MDDCSLSFEVKLEARCVRCRLRREAPEGSDLILLSSDTSGDGISTTCVVATDLPCECGEKRVKIHASLELD